LEELDPPEVFRLAERYGPAPRTIGDAIDDEPAVNDEVNTAVSKLTPEIVTTMMNQDAEIASPSAVAWVRPSPGDTVLRDEHQVYIPTQYIASKLAAHLYGQEQAERLKFLKSTSAIASGAGRAFAGSLFEAEVHAFFRRGGAFECKWRPKPAAAYPKATRAKTKTSSNLPTLPYEIMKSTEERVVYYDLDDIKLHCSVHSKLEDVPDFYWQPTSPTFPSIDCVLYTQSIIFVIQATIAWKHGRIIQRGKPKEGWRQLEPRLQPLIALGARVACLYLVDSEDKGATLCDGDPEKEYLLGFCDLSEQLRPSIEIFRVSPEDPT
jgi:hypothetical protein